MQGFNGFYSWICSSMKLGKYPCPPSSVKNNYVDNKTCWFCRGRASYKHTEGLGYR